MLRGEEALGARRIDECFDAHFFATNFWFMWRSMFGFETWHSAAELRRYLLRFLRLFPDLPTLKIIQSTRYNGRDSIVRPIVRWLERQGVQFDLGLQVTDLDFAAVADGRQAVRRIRATRAGAPADIDLGDGDLVIVTLGSMTRRFDRRHDGLAATAGAAPQRCLGTLGAARREGSGLRPPGRILR